MADQALYNIQSCIDLMNKEQLSSLATELDLGEVTEWSLLKIRRVIRTHLSTRFSDLEDDDDMVSQFLESVVDTIKDSGFEQPTVRRVDAAAAEASGSRDGLENSINDLVSAFRSIMINPPRQATDFMPPSFRKELKFKGKLGDTEETSSIDYGNLKSQVLDAKKSKYPEQEIMSAIKAIILPEANLATLFQADPDLTLDDMLKIICNSQTSQGTSTLFRKLINGRQELGENELSFTLRMIKLKTLIIKAPNAKDSFDETTVESEFRRQLQTGFTNSETRTRMAPILEAGPISNEKLLEQLNKVVTQRRDVHAKLVQGRTDVSEAAIDSTPVESDMQTVLKAIEKLGNNSTSNMSPVSTTYNSNDSKGETQVLLNVIEKMGQQMNPKQADNNTDRMLEVMEKFNRQVSVAEAAVADKPQSPDTELLLKAIEEIRKSMSANFRPRNNGYQGGRQSNQQDNRSSPAKRKMPPGSNILCESCEKSGRDLCLHCPVCVQNKSADRCSHCLSCGSADHRAADCKNKSSLNECFFCGKDHSYKRCYKYRTITAQMKSKNY